MGVEIEGLICGLYARKSTDEQMDSTRVQIREARRYVESKGATLADDCIFIDDGASRAEFVNRPQLWKMVDAAKAKQFSVLIIRDESRLGGDMLRTGLLIQDLVEAGCRIVHYISDEEVRFDDSTSRLITTLRNYAAEIEREKIASRTHEHLVGKARKGKCAGGRVYGYDNVPVVAKTTDGDEQRVFVEYAINEEQAAVVRRIFELRAEGEGYRAIARILNREKVPSPRAGKRGTGSWGYSSVRVISLNERYRGFIPYNRQKKTYRGGTKVRVERPKDEWLMVPAPHLQIVDDELWERAAARRPRSRTTKKRLGRPPKYLLSGILRCGLCGGPMQIVNTKRGSKSIKAYACAWRRNRGPEVCKNPRRRPMDLTDAEVTGHIRERLERYDLVDSLMAMVRRELEAALGHKSAELDELRAEQGKLREETSRLSDAIAAGGSLAALIAALEDRERQLRAVDAKLERLGSEEPVDLRIRRIEAQIRQRLDELGSVFSENRTAARPILEQLFPEGLIATPIEVGAKRDKRWRIEGEALLSLDAPGRVTNMASPARFELALPA